MNIDLYTNLTIQRVIVVGASVSAFDITHEVLHFAKAPVYSSLRTPNPIFGYLPFEHPLIEKKPIISHISLEGDKKIVFFSDGSKVEDVDHIIFGTGYTFSVPFLPSIPIVNRIVPGLYLHVFKQDDPTLAFIGGVCFVVPRKRKNTDDLCLIDCWWIYIPSV
jgi:cation diffusion facilitator CzcD-associated flavoprotein CzcO